MIDNYELKKENGLIATKELDNETIEVTESQFNPLTGKKEPVNTYQVNEMQLNAMVVDSGNQVDAVVKREKSVKAMYADLFPKKKEDSK